MAQTIKLRRSATASAVPTTGQLALGELAINTWDGKLFLKKDNGTQSIVEIGAGGSGASVTVSTTAPSSPAAGDLWWDSTNGKLKIYYTDANTSQWVDAATGTVGAAGPNSVSTSTASTLTGIIVGASGFLYSPSNLTWDNASSKLTVTGQLQLGGTTSSAIQFYLGGTAQSGADTYSVYTDQVIPATATSSASAITSNLSTAAASFTCSAINHFLSTQGSIGAGSAVTNQRGFYAHSTLTGATNNYGFFSDIAAGANRWNFYASGTAQNYFAGQVGIGSGPQVSSQLRIGGTAQSSAATSYATYTDQTAPSTTTSEFYGHFSSISTAAASFTLGSLLHFTAAQGSIGAGSTVTNQYGFYVANNLTGATNNYGFYSNIPASSGDWNFYAAGTAQNYFAGDTGIGIANDGTQILHIAAGSASKAPLEFNAGTLMTSPDAGSMEYDGAAFYLAPFGGSRGVVPAEQVVVLGTAYTLTSQTAAQKLFNATTNGAVNVEADTYWFECGFSLTSMSATSGTFGFALGVGSAVIGSQAWHAYAKKAALATQANPQYTYNTAANTSLTAASTTTTAVAQISGIVRITTAGTLIPQVSLGVAAAAVVGANSYFRIYPISAINATATNITIGNWS